MTWKVPEPIQAQTWSVIEYDEYSVIVPSSDSAAHTIEGFTCPCEPDIEGVEDGAFHHVIHNSWEGKKAIDNSLDNLFEK